MTTLTHPVLPQFNPALLRAGKDIVVKDGEITFGKSYDKAGAEAFLKSISTTEKTIEKIEFKAFKATDEDKSEVRKRLKNPDKFDLDTFGFYEAVVADTMVDFTREKISKPVLDALALQAIDGVSILVNHDSDAVIGHSYAGDVVPIPNQPGEYQFVSKFYVPGDAVMPNGQNAVSAIDSGIWKFVSIGFRNRKVNYVEPTAGEGDYMLVYEFDPANPPVLVEYSMVYRGAQPRASLKSMPGETEFKVKETSVFNMKKYLIQGAFQADGKRKSFEVEAPENTDFAPVQAELDTLATEAKAAETLRAELKAVKEPMVNEIQGVQKKLGQPEDSADLLFSASVSDLAAKAKALHELDAKVNPKGQTARTEKVENPTKTFNPTDF